VKQKEVSQSLPFLRLTDTTARWIARGKIELPTYRHCIYICVHIYVYMYMYIHTNLAYIYVCIYVCTHGLHEDIHEYTDVYVYINT